MQRVPTDAKLKEIELIHDYLKHITSLSTGSILLIVTFLEKLFLKPEWRVLVGITLGGFSVSIVLALTLQFLLINEMDPDTPDSGKFAMVAFAVMAISFVGSILSLTAFALKNLY